MSGPRLSDVRAVTLPVESWQAWKLGERESRELALTDPETLDEAVAQAMAVCCPEAGDKLAVQWRHDGRVKNTLWFFLIRRSTKHFDYRPSTNGGAPVRVGRLYPELQLQTELAAPFAPRLRFDAFRDNAAGRDLTLVEGRAS